MTTYTVHMKEAADPDDVVLVPEGFSLGAFLFTALWAFWKHLWIVGLVALVALTALTAVPIHLSIGPEITGIVQLALSILFGFEANNLRRFTLARSGYREIALVSGDSLLDAELRYFASRTSVAPAAPADAAQPIPARYAHDALGLFGNV